MEKKILKMIVFISRLSKRQRIDKTAVGEKIKNLIGKYRNIRPKFKKKIFQKFSFIFSTVYFILYQ